MPGPIDYLKGLFASGPQHHNLPEDAEREFPEMAQAWAGRQIELPETTQNVKIRPMNFLERFVLPRAEGYTTPFGNIAYNQENLKRGDTRLSDFLVHELKHVEQGRRPGAAVESLKGLFRSPQSYLDRPWEQEAFEAEARRKVRHKDRPLRAPAPMQDYPRPPGQ